jgi:two-component system, chemotaxis family, CheB/CheR fusion protein
MSSAGTSEEFEHLLAILKAHRGFDFTGYKRATLVRRFAKRMDAVGVHNYVDYSTLLLRDPKEFNALFNTVLINVTEFFRDTVPWQYLSEQIIPAIKNNKRHEEPIRVWSAGCASGEEPYSLAMLFAESLGTEEFVRRVKIYATDVDDEALDHARHALYTDRQVEAVPEPLRNRYFDKLGEKYAFKKIFRRNVIFGRNDLVDDAPISKIDLLVCRNTLMYFDAKTQARILRRFHFALRHGGFLLLGKAETLATHANTFAPYDIKRRVFTKVLAERLRDRVPLEFTTEGELGSREGAGELAYLSDAAFDKSSTAQLVVDRFGNLALANDNARALFKLNPADIGRPLQDLELSYRPIDLRTLIDQAHIERRPVRIPETAWSFAGESRWFSVQVVPLLRGGREILGVSINVDDVTHYRELKLELARSHTELATAYEELQSANEELETTNEELHSTVEELETTNEELQSTNEELETMNEELQSTNDELGAINKELTDRGGELDHANHFLEAIFASLRGGVAVVDPSMIVKVWNRQAEELWGVRSDEVVETPIRALDIGLPVKELQELLLTALNDGDRSHERMIPAINRRGKKILCRVVATPLRGTSESDSIGAIVVMEETEKPTAV